MAPQRASPRGALPPGVDDPWALRDGFGFKADGRDFRWIRHAPGQGRLQTADSAGVRSGRPVWKDVLSEEKWLMALSPSGRARAMGLKRIVPIPSSRGGFCLTFGALGRPEDPNPAKPADPTASAPAPAPVKAGEPADAERKLADNLRALRLGRDSPLSLPPAWVGHPRLRICAEADAINALEGPSASRPAAALAGFDLRAEPLGPGRLFVSAASAQTGRSFAGYVDLRLAQPQAVEPLDAHRAPGALDAPAGFAARLTRPEPPSSSLHVLALTDPQGSPAQLTVSWDPRSGSSRWLLFADREGKEGEAPATLPLRLGADARIVGLLGGLLFYFERAPQGAGAAPNAPEKELLFAPLTRKGLGRKSHLAAALAQAKLIDWGNEAIEGAAIARSGVLMQTAGRAGDGVGGEGETRGRRLIWVPFSGQTPGRPHALGAEEIADGLFGFASGNDAPRRPEIDVLFLRPTLRADQCLAQARWQTPGQDHADTAILSWDMKRGEITLIRRSDPPPPPLGWPGADPEAPRG